MIITREQSQRRRIARAVAAITRRACPSLVRHLPRVTIRSFVFGRLSPRTCGYSRYTPEQHRHALTNAYAGRYRPDSSVILVNTATHRTIRELAKTIVHELTHCALARFRARDYPLEEFFAQLAEHEYSGVGRQRLYATRTINKRVRICPFPSLPRNFFV